MNIELSRLAPDPSNARHVASPDPDHIARLAASMKAVGQLQPIVVREDREGGWLIVAGTRRVAAAASLGWTEIEAVEFRCENGEDKADYAIAASAAENMVRAGMHPVDQWRAVTALMDRGYSLEGAADALGIAMTLARRLEWLGRMAPAVLEAIAESPELPQTRDLRVIATAPQDVQEAAAAAARKQRGKAGIGFPWHLVVQACSRTRISRSLAVFPHELIAWDEDLFAEPGSEEQFTTTDTKGFLAAQQAALEARIAASKGRIIAGTMGAHSEMVAPAGYTLLWDDVPKRWKKDDPRKVVAAVATEGYYIGQVRERVVTPKVAKASAANGHDAAEAFEDGPPTRAARDPITKAVQGKLAAMKGEALRRAMEAAPDTALVALKALLLCFLADNVAVSPRAGGTPRGQYNVLTKLLDKDGTVRPLSPQETAAIAYELIGHIIAFDHPNTNFGTSGDAAEWLGVFFDAGKHTDRCDTEEILKGFSGEKLIEIAEAHGIDSSGKVGDVRKRLIGALPDWRPLEFGAKAPEVYEPYDLDAEPEDDEPEAEPEAPEPVVARPRRRRKQEEAGAGA
jgi:ParB/RepB/Spo0J family partition protein